MKRKTRIEVSGQPYVPTQNDREVKLLRMILGNLIQIKTADWQSTELRTFAIGRLEGMLEFKETLTPSQG